jgi:hypothetical protein
MRINKLVVPQSFPPLMLQFVVDIQIC